MEGGKLMGAFSPPFHPQRPLCSPCSWTRWAWVSSAAQLQLSGLQRPAGNKGLVTPCHPLTSCPAFSLQPPPPRQPQWPEADSVPPLSTVENNTQGQAPGRVGTAPCPP